MKFETEKKNKSSNSQTTRCEHSGTHTFSEIVRLNRNFSVCWDKNICAVRVRNRYLCVEMLINIHFNCSFAQAFFSDEFLLDCFANIRSFYHKSWSSFKLLLRVITRMRLLCFGIGNFASLFNQREAREEQVTRKHKDSRLVHCAVLSSCD